MLRSTLPVRTAPLSLVLTASLAVVGSACQGTTETVQAAIETPPAAEVAPEPSATPTTTTPATAAASLEPAAPALDGDDGAAIEAIRRGDYEEARDILGRILFEGHMADARARLDSGLPEEALIGTEAALDLLPRDASAKLLDARARLALAEAGIRDGRPFTQAMIEDALDANLGAGDGPAARLQAARAAYLLGRSDDALRLATEGMESAAGATIDVDRLPQRTLAEAAYAVYAARKGAGAEEPETRPLYVRTETALTSLLGRTPTDPWVHQTLANLYLWDGKPAEARQALMRGIDRIPTDASLVRRLAELARDPEGGADALRTFEELVRRHPDIADAHWFEAEQRFYATLAKLDAGEFLPNEFRRAEQSFVRCRELNADYESSCQGWEVICRNAVGWCLYQLGSIDEAAAAFRSMEEVFEGGIAWELEERLPSGVLGLAFCAQAYHEREDWLAAAEINDLLRRAEPENVAYANDAGFLFRDAAVEIEYIGKRFCQAADGLLTRPETLTALRNLLAEEIAPGDEEEREAFRREANRRMKQARGLMLKSADAYRQASKLAPDDVRIVNDTALVMMYYLHRDIAEAEAMLLRSVELGAAQIEDPKLDEDARFALRSAWGDAHQNLGVLHAIYRKDKATALSWMDKSLAIDPEPRADVREFWAPYLRGEEVPYELDDFLAIRAWGRNCE